MRPNTPIWIRVTVQGSLAASLAACVGAASPDRSLPDAPRLPEEVAERIESRLAELGTAHVPRTRHRAEDGRPRYTNRLLLASSPYLQQHAHNPIDWHPWGDEAFEIARRLSRPVLLSIGYSTCHWCHVMEEESFEDEEIARVINERYVAIKVDREERPDLDAVYMAAVQAMTGRGGWPMTIWLTADREPFFAATYLPARDGDRGVSTGFLTLLSRLAADHERAPGDLVARAVRVRQAITQSLAQERPARGLPEEGLLRAAAGYYERRFDRDNGGIAGAPKFPSSLPNRFLLRLYARTGERRWLDMATVTLDRMAAGGIRDHVGGGFHRYSTDSQWLVPHFEKMLYDNALLALAYLEAFQATGEARFADVAREILHYLERDMTSPDGAFYSATDADSLTPSGEREEGYFFTWTPAELTEALGEEGACVVGEAFDVSERGNFEGRSTLHGTGGLAPYREALLAARSWRPAPLRDEKILAAWNGLAISAFARAGLILGDARATESAARAASFVLARLRREGRLMRSYREGYGAPAPPGFLDDHAFLQAGLLDLHEASGDSRWLGEALALDGELAARFEDREHGGFFMVASDGEQPLVREKPAYDGAEPSGNSVAALSLLRLAALSGDDLFRRRAERTLQAFHDTLLRQPATLSEMLLAVDFHLSRPQQVVIVTRGGIEDAAPLLAALRRVYQPNRVLVLFREEEGAALEQRLPLVRGKLAREGRATAYLCEAGACQLPTQDPQIFERQLRTRPAREIRYPGADAAR